MVKCLVVAIISVILGLIFGKIWKSDSGNGGRVRVEFSHLREYVSLRGHVDGGSVVLNLCSFVRIVGDDLYNKGLRFVVLNRDWVVYRGDVASWGWGSVVDFGVGKDISYSPSLKLAHGYVKLGFMRNFVDFAGVHPIWLLVVLYDVTSGEVLWGKFFIINVVVDGR